MLEAITGGYKTKVSINGATIVLSTPDSISPGVWRLDLLETKECIFEIEENKKSSSYDLIKKSGAGVKKLIASYDERPKAMQALIKVTKALESVKTAANNNVIIENKKGLPWLKIILIIIFGYIAFSLFVVTNPITNVTPPKSPQVSERSAPATAPVRSNAQNVAPTSQESEPQGIGVPMSAEDFLN